MEKRKKSSIVAIVILIVCLISAGYFATVTIMDIMTRGQGQSFYDSLPARDILGKYSYQRSGQGTGSGAGSASQGSGAPGADGGPGAADRDNEGDAAGGADHVFKPALDFGAVALECPGVVAWIYVEDTVIDYPVMQGSDNQYYLNHLPNGVANKVGSIFMDCNNKPDFTDDVTYLYGHHMKTGEMFAVLKNYGEREFYESHRIIDIFTPTVNYEVEVFAAYIVSASMERPPMRFRDEAAFNEYLIMISARSILKSDVEVTYGDRIVSLVTCNYNIENGRLILVGRIR